MFSGQSVADDLGDAELCWDADDDGDCADDAEARATLTFLINGTGEVDTSTDTEDVDLTAEAPENPFERVVFYVQLDAGADTEGLDDNTWAIIGEGRGRAPTANPDGVADTADRQFSWRLNVRGSDLAAAANLIAGGGVTIRAVGYTADGNAVTVGDGNDLMITLGDDA